MISVAKVPGAQIEAAFNHLVTMLLAILQTDEQITVQLVGEHSQFVRFNCAKVRQAGCISDHQMHLTLMHNQRNGFRSFSLTGSLELDWQQARIAIEELRQDLPQLPPDPYVVLPKGEAASREVHRGNLISPDQVASVVLPAVADLDFTGIYAGGSLLRGYADSAGQKHWFETESFSLDYSIFTAAGQAVKGTFAGSNWDQTTYTAKLADAKLQLARLAHPPKSIPKGQYRTYLAPAAIAELIGMFSWGGVSEAELQQGNSALGLLQRGEKQLSSSFTLKEDFRRGLVPRFNNMGEVAPIELPLIVEGKLVNTLVSSRTAKEYDKMANGAEQEEYLRSPEVSPGHLPVAQVLKALDTGLYLSNLHYLNWSDRPAGRITGMTRYACFWVEEGEIIAPIENLRFDESLYRCFGENLIALTDVQEFIPEVGTYEQREPGGIWVPGMLVEDFTYTL
jgi:predicted Zn-dependent protease